MYCFWAARSHRKIPTLRNSENTRKGVTWKSKTLLKKVDLAKTMVFRIQALLKMVVRLLGCVPDRVEVLPPVGLSVSTSQGLR